MTRDCAIMAASFTLRQGRSLVISSSVFLTLDLVLLSCHVHFLILNLPGELASDAWNTEKLIKA